MCRNDPPFHQHKAYVDNLNPEQPRVVVFDHTLYAIVKQIHRNWPNMYGENKRVIMFGGFHIEIVAIKVLVEWFEDTVWTHALIRADIASPGTTDSFLKDFI